MKRILNFMRSIRLAVILLAFLALVCLPSTLIPQNQATRIYMDRYGEPLAGIIVGFGFDNVFASPLFFIASGLFFINLAYCSIWRLVRELRKSGRGRHGPDILHLGLMIFFIGAVVSAVWARDSPVLWMESGDAFTLPKGGRFVLSSFEAEYYDDGRPKAWVSTGQYIDVDGSEQSVSIAVNSPARLEGVKIYQNSYRLKPTLLLAPRPGSGAPDSLEEGDRYDDLAFYGVRPDDQGGWLALFSDASGSPVLRREGDKIGEAFIGGFESREITGLRLARDPGIVLVFLSFLPIAAGLMFILYEKRRIL